MCSLHCNKNIFNDNFLMRGCLFIIIIFVGFEAKGSKRPDSPQSKREKTPQSAGSQRSPRDRDAATPTPKVLKAIKIKNAGGQDVRLAVLNHLRSDHLLFTASVYLLGPHSLHAMFMF